MQFFEKNLQNIEKMATIKEKILSFCKERDIKKSRIAQKIDVSETNFIGKNLQSSIGSDALVKFLNAFPEVSAEWLLRDEGPMLRTNDQIVNLFDGSGKNAIINGINNGTVEQHEAAPNSMCDQCKLLVAKDQVIEAQRITIEALRR